MEKMGCIKDYIESTKAYYLFMMGNIYQVSEWRDFILDKKYLSGAKVAFISNLMLGIKEDIVDNKGALVYESKLFTNALEMVVDSVARKDGDNYIIDGFSFPDAPTVVAIIRNKLAHGKYEIDFLHNRVIIQHKGVDIKINIDKLISFVIMGFRNMLKEQKTHEYTREICIFNRKESLKKSKITVMSDAKNIIKNIHLITFNLKSNDKEIDKGSIEILEDLIAYYRVAPRATLSSDIYKNACRHFKNKGYNFSIQSKSVKNNEMVNEILEIFKTQNEQLDLSYEKQIQMIANEVQRRLKEDYNNFNPIAANVKHLILLRGITKMNSTEFDVLSKYLEDMNINEMKMHYDEFGISLIGMFNSLFIYPFEDILTASGGYKIDRSCEFDFSLLDTSMLNPSKITINDNPLVSAYEKYQSLVKKKNEINDKITKQRENLEKVKGNPNAILAINNNIISLDSLEKLVDNDIINAKGEYDAIDNDFNDNFDNFRNMAMVEGIRNAIAHGNYKFIGSSNLMDTKIIFEDIYEGELTFKVEVKFEEFIEFLENNLSIILDYVDNKNNEVNKSR